MIFETLYSYSHPRLLERGRIVRFGRALDAHASPGGIDYEG